ncbi:MAG: lipocalin family protein [Ignavibacteriae bacterium]|nr:lipocalin family protein [Ignavibacteriota bacterium]MCB0750970.1 lipocalin family protein [Ignavibacteriota bacterium]MCB9208577.1 lipocalin family protein [Ignavibacteriales bacterium]MCB9258313.1 lipocalin family protein [Ignavibacteriales bacterium]
MGKNINKILTVLFLAIIIFACSDDKKSSTEPELVVDQDLVGTWVLTQITSPVTASPETLGLSLTAVFNDDGTVEFTTIDSDGTTVDTGTWGTSNGTLTLEIEGESPASSAYSVTGDKATISGFPVEFQGNVVMAGLEFTKQG